MHNGSTNNVHHDTKEEVKNDSIAKYFNVSLLDRKYLEFLDLIALNPQ